MAKFSAPDILSLCQPQSLRPTTVWVYSLNVVEVEFCEVRGSKVEFEVALRGIGVGLYWAPDVYRALPRPDALSPPSST
jgi:hypothetical protein